VSQNNIVNGDVKLSEKIDMILLSTPDIDGKMLETWKKLGPLSIEEIRKKTDNNTKNIEVVFQYFDELLDKKEKVKPAERYIHL
jgi:hypothetical protein